MEQKINAKDLKGNINETMKGMRNHKRAAMMMDLLVSGKLFGDAGRKVGKNVAVD